MTHLPIEPGQIEPARLDANWRAISAELDAPRPARVERLLRAVGVAPRVARLVAATPALRRAWYLALALVIFIGFGSADTTEPRQSLFVLLTLAPLVPVVGVALAFGPAAEPSYEVQLATPMRGLRLVAIRSTTVLGVSIVFIGLLSALSDIARPMAAAWLLPALAVTSGSLAAMTYLTPRLASSTAGAAWVMVAVIGRASSDDWLGAFGPIGQVGALVATAVFVGLAIHRRTSFDRLSYLT